TGRHLHALAHNRDPRPVQVGRRRRSMGAQHALGRARRTPDEVEAVLAGLVDRVSRRMRAAGRAGRTGMLRLRLGDLSPAPRPHPLRQATAPPPTILSAARGLLRAMAATIERRGLTLVGVAVGNLDDDGIQLELPLERHDWELDAAVDAIRDRFGSRAITRGVLLGKDPGLEMPMLPD